MAARLPHDRHHLEDTVCARKKKERCVRSAGWSSGQFNSLPHCSFSKMDLSYNYLQGSNDFQGSFIQIDDAKLAVYVFCLAVEEQDSKYHQILISGDRNQMEPGNTMTATSNWGGRRLTEPRQVLAYLLSLIICGAGRSLRKKQILRSRVQVCALSSRFALTCIVSYIDTDGGPLTGWQSPYAPTC